MPAGCNHHQFRCNKDCHYNCGSTRFTTASTPQCGHAGAYHDYSCDFGGHGFNWDYNYNHGYKSKRPPFWLSVRPPTTRTPSHPHLQSRVQSTPQTTTTSAERTTQVTGATSATTSPAPTRPKQFNSVATPTSTRSSLHSVSAPTVPPSSYLDFDISLTLGEPSTIPAQLTLPASNLIHIKL